MLRLFKGFLKEEDGLGTVEIVVIIAVLVTIALLFRKFIVEWVTKTLGSIFGGEMGNVQDGSYDTAPDV